MILFFYFLLNFYYYCFSATITDPRDMLGNVMNQPILLLHSLVVYFFIIPPLTTIDIYHHPTRILLFTCFLFYSLTFVFSHCPYIDEPSWTRRWAKPNDRGMYSCLGVPYFLFIHSSSHVYIYEHKSSKYYNKLDKKKMNI